MWAVNELPDGGGRWLDWLDGVWKWSPDDVHGQMFREKVDAVDASNGNGYVIELAMVVLQEPTFKRFTK